MKKYILSILLLLCHVVCFAQFTITGVNGWDIWAHNADVSFFNKYDMRCMLVEWGDYQNGKCENPHQVNDNMEEWYFCASYNQVLCSNTLQGNVIYGYKIFDDLISLSSKIVVKDFEKFELLSKNDDYAEVLYWRGSLNDDRYGSYLLFVNHVNVYYVFKIIKALDSKDK